MPQLIIKWGSRETRFAVTTPSIDIGRSEDNLLQIKNVKVSRYHCRIVRTPMGFLLSDSQSSNGTLLNGKRVERNLLKDNDVIKIGNVDIVFLASDSESESRGPVIIPSGSQPDDASIGEVTTIINIQEENTEVAVKPAVVTAWANGAVKNNSNGASKVAVAVAQPAKRVEPSVKTENDVAKPADAVAVAAVPVNGAVTAKPVIAQKVMMQNGSGKLNSTPPQANRSVLNHNNGSEQAHPVRPVTPNPVPRPVIAARPERPGLASRPLTPVSKAVPPPPAPAPKSQSGPISRLAPRAAAPKPATATSSSRLAFNKGKTIKTAVRPSGRIKEDGAEQEPKPRKKGMFYIIGAGAVILIVVIAFVVFSGSNKRVEEDNKREVELLEKANKLYDGKEYSEALKEYEAFIDQFKDSKYAGDVKDRMKKIKERDEKEKEARPKLAGLKKKKKDYPTGKYPELLKEFDEFIREYAETSVIQDAKSERDTVKRIASSSADNETNISFNEMMAEVNKLREKKDYDGALAKLKLFMKENPSLNDRQENTIKTEIKTIEREKSEKSEKK